MARVCVGVDLGGTFTKFVLLPESGPPGEVMQHPTPPAGGGEAVAACIVDGVKKLLAAHDVAKADVLGIGIGSPGPLNITDGIVLATPNVAGMENFPLRDRVSKALGSPATLENDANAAAYGEFICGVGKDVDDMVLLTLGTGVGGGIIIHGRILHGAHEMGAELGHMIVEPDGELCGCGQRGCLERYCSATYIARRAQGLIEQGQPSTLKDVLDAKGHLDARDIQEAAAAGDSLAVDVWDRGMRFLALGCVNICRIFDPDEIVLAGGMTQAGGRLLDPVMAHFEKLHWSITDIRTRIALAALGNDAGAIGAAGVAWQAFGPADGVVRETRDVTA